MWSGADKHHMMAPAMSSGCKHLKELVAAAAAASSPNARTWKNSVSTIPGEMPETRSGTLAARACNQECLLAQVSAVNTQQCWWRHQQGTWLVTVARATTYYYAAGSMRDETSTVNVQI